MSKDIVWTNYVKMFNKYVEIIRNYVEIIANVLFWLDDCVSQKNRFTIMRTCNYNYANRITVVLF